MSADQPPVTETLAKAKLIPIVNEQPSTDESTHIVVQFNPASLRLNITNNTQADTAGGNSGNSAQYVDRSSSTLTIQLLFDTSVAQEGVEPNTDVRVLTNRIVSTFLVPQQPPQGQSPQAPARCRFQWGSFAFVGMLSSYGETLDFFAPEGIPLRSTLALSLKEDRYEFQRDASVRAQRDTPPPLFTPVPSNATVNQITEAAGQNGEQWQPTALANGIEDPRQVPPGAALVYPQQPASQGGNEGYTSGRADSLGAGVPGVNFGPLRPGTEQLTAARRQADELRNQAQQATQRS